MGNTIQVNRALFALLLPLILNSGFLVAETQPILLNLDATEAPRKIFHCKMVIPATPGPLTLLYPKWIPGDHGPTGTIQDLTGLKFSAGGKEIPWERDLVDMFAIHLQVPEQATNVEAELDYVSPASAEGSAYNASATSQLVIVNWNNVVLYPKSKSSDDVFYVPSIRLPEDWKHATALVKQEESGGTIQFKPVSLTTLIDSPLIAGIHFRSIPLNTGAPPIVLNVVADSDAALEFSAQVATAYKQLAAETLALFGAHHFEKYDFLLALSDRVQENGLEHHESSDNRVPEKTMIKADRFKIHADLLPHELVHSWNGKYRRPADLATSNYDVPMRSDLIWIYEGLTNYLGCVLAARSGLWSPTDYEEQLALKGAMLDYRAGRQWRPLVDTAVSAQILYEAPDAWQAWRRGVDFYEEGELIWLEADVWIRQQTHGKKSLDDFCKAFFGQPNTPPMLKTYTEDDVYAALNQIAPQDWKSFFHDRIYSITKHAPLNGIQNGGWQLVYKDFRTSYQTDDEEAEDLEKVDLTESIGIRLDENGGIVDVVPGMAAATAGIGPGMKLIAVNGRRYDKEMIRAALKATTKEGAKLELLVENADYFKTFQLNYDGGERYPHLTT